MSHILNEHRLYRYDRIFGRVILPLAVFVLLASLNAYAVVINSITPNSGPIYGGTTVTIYGDGFLIGAAVKIGGVQAGGIKVVGLTTISCRTGKINNPGVYLVEVINPDATKGVLDNEKAFFYFSLEKPVTKEEPGRAGLSVDINRRLRARVAAGGQTVPSLSMPSSGPSNSIPANNSNYKTAPVSQGGMAPVNQNQNPAPRPSASTCPCHKGF